MNSVTEKYVGLTHQPVELYKILKFEGLADSGAAAKLAIADALVRVNGEVETRKRKQIRAGDIIEFDNHILTIALQSAE